LDLDGNGKLLLNEFKYLYRVMDLNNDEKLTPSEVGAWFKSNEYSICHPFRNQILKTLKKHQSESLTPLFRFFDANSDQQIDQIDVLSAIEKIDKNGDAVVSKLELEAATSVMLQRICAASLDNDREGWILRMGR